MSDLAQNAELTVQMQGHVAVVEVDRPPVNFFDLASVTALVTQLQALDADPACRAIVLAAAGKVFCAGADFGRDAKPDEIAGIAEQLYAQAVQIFEIRTPMIAAVQGPAIGGGLGLALAADFRVAGPDARFSANFARLGMHCGFGISVTLPRAVGQNMAAQLLMTGRRIDGKTAAKIGLADVLDEDARAGAMTLAQEIADSAPLAVQDMRATLRAGLAEEVRTMLTHELECQRRHIRTKDFIEGIRATAERRPAAFTGK